MTKPNNPWTEAEDAYIEENYTGLLSISEIAKELGRTCVATERRIKIIHSQPLKITTDKDLIACLQHGEDLRLSGGRWR